MTRSPRCRLLMIFTSTVVVALLGRISDEGFPGLEPETAEAFNQVLCQPDRVASARMRRAINPHTGHSYDLNERGCAPIAQTDIDYFLGLGFSAGPPLGSLLYNTGVATGATSFRIGTLPPASYIEHIIVNNLTENAVAGGIAFGSNSGGDDIVAALPCPANCLAFGADTALLKRVFSVGGTQAIYANPVTDWNSANLNITVIYGYF